MNMNQEEGEEKNNKNKPTTTQILPKSHQTRVRYRRSKYVVVQKDAKTDGCSVCPPNKEMDPSQVCQTASPVQEDVTKKVSAKSRLNQICTVERWEHPKYECCNEEGPGHMKSFTLKVVVEIQKPEVTTLECYGGPQRTKKKAAEHAAEGALWYLRQTGHKLAANK